MKQHHKIAGSPAHDHDHGHAGHDHAGHDHSHHGHDHGHHHGHTHDHHPPAAAMAEVVGWSLLRASLAERLLVAAGFTALAWALIGLALT